MWLERRENLESGKPKSAMGSCNASMIAQNFQRDTVLQYCDSNEKIAGAAFLLTNEEISTARAAGSDSGWSLLLL
jgi:hypothetical protein